MSEDLQSQLRAALRPIAPSAALEKKLIACVTAKPPLAPPVAGRPGRPGFHPRARWLSLGVAACLLLALGIQHRLQERHERENGLEARRQVLQALRMTSQKLDLAYEIVKSQSTSLADENPGA